MRRIVIIVFMAAIILGFHSCTEDEFLEPTTIDLQIKMVNTNPLEGLDKIDNKGTLKFDEGTLQLTSIEFDGERENDNTHYFSHEFDDVLTGDLTNGSLNKPVSFDIPQGSYNPIKITLHTDKSENSPGLRFRGKWEGNRPGGNPPYNNDDDQQEEAEIEFNFFEHHEAIELTLENEEGDKQVVFNQNNWNTLEIRINMVHMFRYFNPQALEVAEFQQQREGKKIIISARHNQQMYYSLANRVERSFKAVIK